MRHFLIACFVVLVAGVANAQQGVPGVDTVVSDKQQRHGLGTELLRRLVEIGRSEGVKRITADILPDNKGMLRVAEKIGFTLKLSKDDEVMKATIDLK